MSAASTTPVQDGFTDGQRDRALVLDYIAIRNPSDEHPAYRLSDDEFESAVSKLILDGLAGFSEPLGFTIITPAGLAAHRAAHQLLDEMSRILDGQG